MSQQAHLAHIGLILLLTSLHELLSELVSRLMGFVSSLSSKVQQILWLRRSEGSSANPSPSVL